jgi:hypothetical protein
MVPDVPLKETEAQSSRFAALVFVVEARVSIGCDAHGNDGGLTGWISKPNLYPRDHAQEMWYSPGQSLHRTTAPPTWLHSVHRWFANFASGTPQRDEGHVTHCGPAMSGNRADTLDDAQTLCIGE